MLNEEFPPRLELVLKALSISRGRLAAELGVDKSVVSRWLNGANAPTGHNLSNLTAFVAARRTGFTMLDWELEPPKLATKLGVVNGTDGANGHAPPMTDFLPPAILRDALHTTASRAEDYEGFWRSTRVSNEHPGRFVHDRILITRGDHGLLRVRTGVIEMRFDGISIPHQTQLFGISVDAKTGVFLFAIFNAVLRHRADVMDGLTLTCTRTAGGTAVVGACLMERTGVLSGDMEADEARYEASIESNPLAPQGSISAKVRDHLFRDSGPTALERGGEAMLTMAFAASMARGPMTGVPWPE